MRIAYLAPEIPSVSGTFVYREILAIERTTSHEVLPFSLHPVRPEAVAEDGRAFLARTSVLYERPFPLLVQAFKGAARRPLRALRTAWMACGDLFREPQFPVRLAAQCLAGMALGDALCSARMGHLHVHFAHAPATVGMYAARFAGIPFSVTAHANDLYVHAQLLRVKLRRATPFVTISDVNRRFLVDSFGSDARSVELVRCGVDSESFPSREEATGVPLLFATGRLVEKKGFDVLLRALSQVSGAWTCVIAGDGPERERLELLAERLGLASCVTFLGAVDTQSVRAHLRRARAFVLPCRRAKDGDVDGIPVALMEAMASSVPVVSTRLSGVPELIEDQCSGRLVEPEDAEGLADAINELLADPAQARRLGRGGRQVVNRDFDVYQNAMRLVRAIHSEARSTGKRGCGARLRAELPAS